jgi:hypothetical protein
LTSFQPHGCGASHHTIAAVLSRYATAVNSPHVFGQVPVAHGNLIEELPSFDFVAPVGADGVLRALIRERVRLASAAVQIIELAVPSLDDGEQMTALEQEN